MGNRLSTIVTRTGDSGTTGTADGSRRAKNDVRVQCLGEVDELNAALGVALSFLQDSSEKQSLFAVQHDLFDIGAELCQPGKSLITHLHLDSIESNATKFNNPLPAVKEFIIPGGSQAVAFLQLTRTICRRLERTLVTLKETEDLNPITAQYVNRLSDLLFILARSVANQDPGSEVYWQSKYSRQQST
jgi:cob(I)alamin adenosyltransferase